MQHQKKLQLQKKLHVGKSCNFRKVATSEKVATARVFRTNEDSSDGDLDEDTDKGEEALDDTQGKKKMKLVRFDINVKDGADVSGTGPCVSLSSLRQA